MQAMSSDSRIKHMMPHKNSKFKQGIILPASCKKYFNSCKDAPIIYRSALERMFIEYSENDSSIQRWASEPISITYYSRLDKKEKNYYPDFVIENSKGIRSIVEVKPSSQVEKPKSTDSIWSKQTWIKNVDKWNAAKAFAQKHGMKFIIITEKFFSI